jgi:hypothetical protein
MASRPYNAREITIRLERETLDDFGETAFAILRNLIFGSPVGNPTLWQFPDSAPDGYVGGHFRRNWLVSIGGFTDVEIGGVDPAGAATLASGRNKIDTFTRRGKPGVNLVIQNNVPYANRLAQGHSTQAPAGWVNTQIDAALGIPGGREDLP